MNYTEYPVWWHWWLRPLPPPAHMWDKKNMPNSKQNPTATSTENQMREMMKEIIFRNHIFYVHEHKSQSLILSHCHPLSLRAADTATHSVMRHSSCDCIVHHWFPCYYGLFLLFSSVFFFFIFFRFLFVLWSFFSMFVWSIAEFMLEYACIYYYYYYCCWLYIRHIVMLTPNEQKVNCLECVYGCACGRSRLSPHFTIQISYAPSITAKQPANQQPSTYIISKYKGKMHDTGGGSTKGPTRTRRG